MLPKQFKPNHLYDLIRLGRNNDGGYLVGENSVLNAKFKNIINKFFIRILKILKFNSFSCSQIIDSA